MRRVMFVVALFVGFPLSLSAAPSLPFDPAIAWGQKHGIHITLALHRAPECYINPPPEAENLWISGEAHAAFTAHWEMFARRYENVPAARLDLNLVNDPSRTTPENVMRDRSD